MRLFPARSIYGLFKGRLVLYKRRATAFTVRILTSMTARSISAKILLEPCSARFSKPLRYYLNDTERLLARSLYN